MANYTTLRYGSTGDEVKKLQQKLGIQDDGIYGSQTQSAVEEYQRKNGLQVDGIAGNETLGHMYAEAVQNAPSVQAQQQTAVTQPTQAAQPAETGYRYNAQEDQVYQLALKQLEEAKQNKPVYAGTYDDQLQAIFDKIMNREDFSYDMNSDPVWNQLKDQKVQQGQMAMMDTIGQAAALTGGYGNTYGQLAGQQAYQGYLQQLYEQVPELYQLALSRYQTEGDKLSEQFAMIGQLAGDEYAKHQDALSQYWQNVDRAQSAADTAYDRGQSSWYTEQQLQTQADDTQYSRRQDAYDKLVSLISSTGYSPSAEELAAAGMSTGEAAAYAKYYADQNAPKGTGGGGGDDQKYGDYTLLSDSANADIESDWPDGLITNLGVWEELKATYGEEQLTAAGYKYWRPQMVKPAGNGTRTMART